MIAMRYVVDELVRRDLMTPPIAAAIAEIGGPQAKLPEVAYDGHGYGSSFRDDTTYQAGRVTYNYKSFGRDPVHGPQNTLTVQVGQASQIVVKY